MNKYSDMGKARAKSLSKEERSAIARKAAIERWEGNLMQATHEGNFPIGENSISCAVLPNGQRIITQSTFLRALGRARSLGGGRGVTSTATDLPFFLQNEAVRPYLTNKDLLPTKPVFFKDKHGKKSLGYDASLLPKVAEIYLKFRDDWLKNGKAIPRRYENTILASDILIRGLANVGIVALVDEATGYQNVRAKNALAVILEQFIAKELRPWIKTFPDEFYEQLFRLKGLNFPHDTVRRPKSFGKLTNDIVYARLAPGVLAELKQVTPKDDKGRLKQHMHRRLSGDVGHPKLREHLAAVVALMKISSDYDTFHDFLDRTYPKFNNTYQLPLGDEHKPKSA